MLPFRGTELHASESLACRPRFDQASRAQGASSKGPAMQQSDIFPLLILVGLQNGRHFGG